jgi:uncharacterized protein (DUF885 family)
MNHRKCAVVFLTTLAMFLPAAVWADGQEMIKGRIEDVRPSAHQVKLTTENGKKLTLHVDDHSRLERQGRQVSLDGFHKGMRVQVTFESRDGQDRVVFMTQAPVTVKELENDIRDTLEDVRSYTFDDKGAYYQRLRDLVRRADELIEQLKHKAAPTVGRVEKQYDEQIDQLRRLRDRAEAEAERVKSAAPGAWQDIKSGVRSAFEDLRKGLDKAAEHFR